MAATLQDQGFRFYHLASGGYGWAHPLDGPRFITDCTDMDDEAFAEYVAANESA